MKLNKSGIRKAYRVGIYFNFLTMKNLKKLKRNELSKVLGADRIIDNECPPFGYTASPVDGACPTGYIYCSLPKCCFRIDKPYACLNY